MKYVLYLVYSAPAMSNAGSPHSMLTALHLGDERKKSEWIWDDGAIWRVGANPYLPNSFFFFRHKLLVSSMPEEIYVDSLVSILSGNALAQSF